MWLSEQVRRKNAGGASAGVGGVTIGGESAAVMLNGEYRGLKTLLPEGIYWRPGAGTQVMVLTTDDGERFILGTADEQDIPPLDEGELCLKSGKSWLKFGADGVISAEGEIQVNGNVQLNGNILLGGRVDVIGKMYVTGSLLVNNKNVKLED